MAYPKHSLSYFSFFLYNNDCVIEHPEEERYVAMTCMLDDMFYVDDLPKFDQYDNDDYVFQIKSNLAEKSTVGLWEEVQFQ